MPDHSFAFIRRLKDDLERSRSLYGEHPRLMES